MNFGFLTTLDNLLLPYLLNSAKKNGIENIFVFVDTKGLSEKDKNIFQVRTKGRFGEKINSDIYLKDLSNLNIPFYFVDNHNSESSLELYSLLKIHCLFNGGTPRKISSKLLNQEFIPGGVINIHPGKLPEYRGCSAVEWAILNDDEIVNTIHYMDEDYDTGPVIKMESYKFDSKSSYIDIRSEVYLKGIELACSVLKNIQDKLITFKDSKEQSNLNAKYWEPISKSLEELVIEKANNKKYSFQNLINK